MAPPTAQRHKPPTISKVGILPNSIYNRKGPIGIISRSGTLTYELSFLLSQAGFGQSTVVGVGGETPVTGIDTVETAMMFEKDDETKLIVAVGGRSGGRRRGETGQGYTGGQDN